MRDPARQNRDIWVYNLPRGVRSRFTFDPADEYGAIWSPDGRRVAFNRKAGVVDQLYVKPSDGSGDEQLLVNSGIDKYPSGWSPDQRFILYENRDPQTTMDLWVIQVGETEPRPFLKLDNRQESARFSPDGRWVAYQSNESGRPEIYVTTFPAPRWHRDGSELFYLTLDNTLMAVEISTRATEFTTGPVRQLFQIQPHEARSFYDVAPDGQRFLVNTVVMSTPQIHLMVNWTRLLTQ